jgi:hypothetical protein
MFPRVIALLDTLSHRCPVSARAHVCVCVCVYVWGGCTGARACVRAWVCVRACPGGQWCACAFAHHLAVHYLPAYVMPLVTVTTVVWGMLQASKTTTAPWANFVGALLQAAQLAQDPNTTYTGIVIQGANSTAPPPTQEGYGSVSPQKPSHGAAVSVYEHRQAQAPFILCLSGGWVYSTRSCTCGQQMNLAPHLVILPLAVNSLCPRRSPPGSRSDFFQNTNVL